MIEIRLIDIAQVLNAQLHGDKNIVITGIASIHSAKKGHITFFKDHRFKKELSSSQASAVILSKIDLIFCHTAAVVVKDPYLAYVQIARLMDTASKPKKIIAPNVVISSDVTLGKRIGIEANVVIESGVVLGDDVSIGSGSFIGRNTKIGSGTRLFANVTIYHEVKIGENCLIQSGAVIGADGFGYVNDNGSWIKIPQLGKVRIGNHVEIGACTTIDRGTLDDTCIGNGVIIDNQCLIAHNVIIGEYTAIAGGVIMAGSLTIGKYCMIGGASVINGHINICDKVTITGMGMVMRPIKKSGIYSSGIPIQPNTVWRRTAALVMRISSINTRMKNIEQKIKQLLFFLSSK